MMNIAKGRRQRLTQAAKDEGMGTSRIYMLLMLSEGP